MSTRLDDGTHGYFETDKDRIEALVESTSGAPAVEEWLDCRVCREVFARRRPTLTACDRCGQAYCEGEHGVGGTERVCLRCMFEPLAIRSGETPWQATLTQP